MVAQEIAERISQSDPWSFFAEAYRKSINEEIDRRILKAIKDILSHDNHRQS